MDISIMQPYLFPYIGYYQMIKCSDIFVVADDVQYIKKGWINRNRILLNGEAEMITMPLKSASSFLNINERYFSNHPDSKGRRTFMNKIENSYYKAPEFSVVFPLLERIINFENNNVADFLINSIKVICQYLDIKTELLVESDFNLSPVLHYQDTVIHICKELKAKRYINSIGGMDLYSNKKFKENDIHLKFIKTRESLKYRQYYDKFVPNLSIVDVMMFNSPQKIQTMLTAYDLIDGRD